MPTNVAWTALTQHNHTGLPFSGSDVLPQSLSPFGSVFRTQYTTIGLDLPTLNKVYNWSNPLPGIFGKQSHQPLGSRVSAPAIDDDGKTHWISFSERRPSSVMTFNPADKSIKKTKLVLAQPVEIYEPEIALLSNTTLLLSTLVPQPGNLYSAILLAINLGNGSEIWRHEETKGVSARVILRVFPEPHPIVLWMYADRFYRIETKSGIAMWEHIIWRKDPDPRTVCFLEGKTEIFRELVPTLTLPCYLKLSKLQ